MENLLLAYKKASKNRRSRQEVANFEFELERNLFQIRDKLEDGSYHHNSPSLGGDAETSEVSRHGTQNLFSKASFFRFALRPRHAFCPHFTQSRRGRRDKRGFPSRHPQFTPQDIHNLFSKASLFRFAWRPRHAFHQKTWLPGMASKLRKARLLRANKTESR
jgi:hypothetical protein